MKFQPSTLRAEILEEAMVLKYTGMEYSYQVRLQRHTPCSECGVEITAGYMTVHQRPMHSTESAID